MELKFTAEQLERIMWDSDIELEDGTEFEYKLIEEPRWEDQGKFHSGTVVFEHKDKFYMFGVQRSGTHWRGYELEFWDTDVWEVEQQEVVRKVWVAVDHNKSVEAEVEEFSLDLLESLLSPLDFFYPKAIKHLTDVK